jgi:uncharacterized protein YneF (UPF0154 family)
MNNNIKGMLWTAAAIVVGITLAGFIKAKLMKKTTETEVSSFDDL